MFPLLSRKERGQWGTALSMACSYFGPAFPAGEPLAERFRLHKTK